MAKKSVKKTEIKKEKKPLEAKIKKLRKARDQFEELQNQVVSALFQQYPNLQSVELASAQDYDDNNYYEVLQLESVNGVEWDNEISDPNIDYLNDLDEEDEAYRGWLVEANLTINEFDAIVETLSTLDESYIKSREGMEMTRKEYLPEELS